MRLTSSEIFRTQTDVMSREMAQYGRLLRQAEGKKLLLDSDEPVLASEISSAGTELDILKGYESNIAMAVSRSELFGVASQNTENILSNVRGLLLRVQNDTLSDTDRQSIAAEVKGCLNELLRTANTQDASGAYIFSGSMVGTAPFASVGGVYEYQGSQDQVEINILPGVRAVWTESGSGIFGDVMNTLSGFATLLEQPVTDRDAFHQSLSTVQAAFDGDTAVVQTWQSSEAASTGNVKRAKSDQESMVSQATIRLSSLADSNTEAVYSALSQQSVVLQATQAAYVKLHEVVTALLKMQLE